MREPAGGLQYLCHSGRIELHHAQSTADGAHHEICAREIPHYYDRHPLSQGVVDLYAQMRFLSPKILGYPSFYSFAANHLEYSDKFPGMIVRAHNTKYIAAKIKPYIYQITKEECLNLPAKLYETRYCSLTDSQRYHYEKVKDEVLDETKPDEWDSVAVFRLFTALQRSYRFLHWKGKNYEFDCERPQLLRHYSRSAQREDHYLLQVPRHMDTICSKL